MPTSAKPKLTVYAEEGGAVEITVQDGAFNVIARGEGNLHLALDPGIYTVVANSGSQSWKKMVVLDPGKTRETVSVPPLVFASPVPLLGTSQSHEYHQSAVEFNSRRVHASVGMGSAIFISVREFSSSSMAAPRSRGNPLSDLMLLDAGGKELVDLMAAGAVTMAAPGTDPWGCCNILLDPGFYRLRQTLPSGDTVDLGLVASPGWQTQVFALLGSYGGADPTLLADLTAASILMSRFDPSQLEDDRGGYAAYDQNYQRGNRLAEIARLGLTNNRAVLKHEMYEMLFEKYSNPMLGILGANLLLAQNALQEGLLQRVIDNLRNLVGQHPDVEALVLALPGAVPDYPFPFPPMLRRSWERVVKASWAHPSLVPKDSLSYQVATCLWGEEPWNLWRTRMAETSFTPAPLLLTRNSFSAALSPYEKAVIHQVSSAAASDLELPPDDLAAEMPFPAGLNETTPEQLAESLGLPRANVEDLLEKLKFNASLYEVYRAHMLPGKKRTKELEKIVSEFRVMGLRMAAETAGLVAQLVEDDSPGNRVAALALLQVNPDAVYFPFILKTIESPKSAFEQYHGLVAAHAALQNCSDAQKMALRSAVEAQRQPLIPRFKPGSDRWTISDLILRDLDKPET